jgi:hypothetical protein
MLSKYAGFPDLVRIEKLEANWDSYGAKPIDQECLEHAHWLMSHMPNWWTAVPCADGSIQLERHSGGIDLELHISRAAQETAVAPKKGELGGECNRGACNDVNARWWNPHTQAHYCTACARLINESLKHSKLALCELH